jgi:glycerophosphoryl diester phosphodiesterase
VAPENTLPAFASALDLGVDFVEFDTQVSAEGVPVVFHDETLDRTTDACSHWNDRGILLASKSLADLKQLDAGRWYGERFVGTEIPTLVEALRLISPRSMTMVERKIGDAAAHLRAIEDCRATDRVIVQAFDWAFLADCRRQSPHLLLGALGEKEITEPKLDEAKALGVSVIGWEASYFTPDNIAAIHRRGLRAWAWTVDDVSLARQLIAAGIDGLISNVPAKIQAILKASP